MVAGHDIDFLSCFQERSVIGHNILVNLLHKCGCFVVWTS